MPVPIIIEALTNGLESMPVVHTFLQYVWKVFPYVLAIALAKWYFGGARNTSERTMHSKVVMMTASYLQKSVRSQKTSARSADWCAREVPQVSAPWSRTSSRREVHSLFFSCSND